MFSARACSCIQYEAIYCILTFVAESESPFLSSLNVGNPQVVVVDEGYEVGVSGADLGVHAGP